VRLLGAIEDGVIDQLKRFWEISNAAEGASYEVMRAVSPQEAAQLIRRAKTASS
jgi:hypothetical protein